MCCQHLHLKIYVSQKGQAGDYRNQTQAGTGRQLCGIKAKKLLPAILSQMAQIKLKGSTLQKPLHGQWHWSRQDPYLQHTLEAYNVGSGFDSLDF